MIHKGDQGPHRLPKTGNLKPGLMLTTISSSSDIVISLLILHS